MSLQEEIQRQWNLARSQIAQLETTIADTSTKLERTIKSIQKQTALVKKFDNNKFRAFLDKPYLVRPLKPGHYELIVPTFVGFSAGWPVRHTDEYSIFLVTRFINFINPLPQWLADDLGFKRGDFKAVLDGDVLEIIEGDAAKVYEKLGGDKIISRRVGNKLFIRQASRFDILRRIIREEGFLPYTPQPIPQDAMRDAKYFIAQYEDKPSFELRDHQQKDFAQFKELGAACILAYPQTGKSYVVLQACAAIAGPKIIFAPSRALLAQWRTRLEYYLTPVAAAEVTVSTYHSAGKFMNKKWSLVVFDEAHHIPADFAIEASAKIKTIARLGLSATPFREDGQEDLIPALCGFPLGVNWPVSDLQRPTIHVWIVPNEKAKYKVVTRFLSEERVTGKTFVFTRLLEIGERVARQNRIPFVSGKTKDAIDVIEANDVVVISSVGNEGLSFNVSRVIEVDFHYGSRMEFGQRLGRLGYADGKIKAGVYHLLMTPHEYERYGKRLLIAEQWGLDVDVNSSDQKEKGFASISLPRMKYARVPARMARLSTRRPPKEHDESTNGKPNDEIGKLLSLPSIAAKISMAEKSVGRTTQPYIRRSFRKFYDAAYSNTEIIEALGITNVGDISRYNSAIKALHKVGIFEKQGERYTVNHGEVARLQALHQNLK